LIIFSTSKEGKVRRTEPLAGRGGKKTRGDIAQ